ncbi:MAG: binding-protein-dependent transport system inner rane component [Bradyrhizobium sp.]|nr:binding-protein-dependent transport system inner rane component [Bradyrhizobium sp.]
MLSRFVVFSSLGRKALPNQWDVAALAIILAIFVAVAQGSHGLTAPLPPAESAPMELDYWQLPYYGLRTTLRMFAAIAASLVFTLTYATLAAKSKRAEQILIPLLDVLQSVPILGFLSFTVTFFLGLFPGSTLGAECAAIFAIFTSQAWNMAFSFYQSLRTVPKDLEEVATGFGLSPWQRFWQLEAPFAMPGLTYNTMMSMSGGWFFVVASEAISVGDTTIKLPGIGSWLAVAIDNKNVPAVIGAVVAMLVIILLYDQILFRPLVVFSQKFRVELSMSQFHERSWVRDIFVRATGLRRVMSIPGKIIKTVGLLRLDWVGEPTSRTAWAGRKVALAADIIWYAALAVLAGWSIWQVVGFVSATLSWTDLSEAALLTIITMARVVALIALATLFWVPISVWIGLRPALAEKAQPLAQFLAAFPANVVFPVAVIAILHWSLNPDIWLSFLVVFGTQWYIVFNVIAGASAFPNDLKEVSANFGVKGWTWWRKVILPGIFPYYVTGALTASGGSWNAAIVAEYVKWGDDKVEAHGIGSYIAKATAAGDFPRIVLGVAVMSICVIAFNRLFWRPLFGFAERRLRLM